jgi:CubicO group peptidase (beta-lactamase class C family)
LSNVQDIAGLCPAGRVGHPPTQSLPLAVHAFLFSQGWRPNPVKNPVLRFLLVALFVAGKAFCQSSGSTSDAVSLYVKAEMARQHIPGVALLVSRKGEPVRAQGFGFSNVELQVPVKPDTLFQSGSVGKQFTATAIMMLVDEGKISLDDSITKYFPDAPASWKPVTVRHLLSHTGGFTDYPKNFNFRMDYSEDELLKIVEAIPLSFPAGTNWSYSNLGYLTLGILIHRVTGTFYGDVLQARIFRPLEMQTTRIISEADIIPNRSAGYRLVKGELKNQEWVSPVLNTTADGSLYFSILDLAKWDAALYTEKLLKRSSLEQMWTVIKLNNGQPNSGQYGFGWEITSSHGHRLIDHDGAWQGFKTQISRYVDDKLTVVVLANLAEANPGKIAEHVAELYLKGDSVARPASGQ